MTPHAVLIELLARLAALRNAPVLVSDHDLDQWPSEAVAAMKSQKLIAKARSGTSAVCPGRERECVMPVHSLSTAKSGSESFIACDKRSDINRVPVALDRLTQWQCSTQAVCEFVAETVGIRSAIKQTDHAGLWEIGVATGNKRSQMLCLRVNNILILVAGNNALPLPDFIGYADGAYSIDTVMVGQLVDHATTADVRYTPSTTRREARRLDTQTMYERWRKEYRAQKKKRPNMSDVWYSRHIAKSAVGSGRDASTIKKKMKS